MFQKCPVCDGMGFVHQYIPSEVIPKSTCPKCNGTMVIDIETGKSPDNAFKDVEIPKDEDILLKEGRKNETSTHIDSSTDNINS